MCSSMGVVEFFYLLSISRSRHVRNSNYASEILLFLSHHIPRTLKNKLEKKKISYCRWVGTYIKKILNFPYLFKFHDWPSLITTWQVSVFGVFLVRNFPHSDWILRISPYSVRMRENTDQKTLNTDTFHAVDGNWIMVQRNANLTNSY